MGEDDHRCGAGGRIAASAALVLAACLLSACMAGRPAVDRPPVEDMVQPLPAGITPLTLEQDSQISS